MAWPEKAATAHVNEDQVSRRSYGKSVSARHHLGFIAIFPKRVAA